MVDLWAKSTNTFDQTTIITVCEGNICRSPLAEQLMRVEFQARGIKASLSSAGLGALVGHPMEATQASISIRMGGDPSTHIAKQMNSALAKQASLILTMSASQRDRLVREFPRALRRTFTLTEFAQLVEMRMTDGTGSKSIVEIVRDLAATRARVTLGKGDDILDPYRQPHDVHERVAAQIEDAVRRIAIGLAQ